MLISLMLVVACDSAPEVELQGAGRVRGVATANGGAYFLSLPFAAPPVKEKRWLPPQPVPPWSGTIDASTFKPACAQAADWTGQPEPSIPGGGQGSEDCLYLDVYTPSLRAGAAGGPLAVLLFVHGGGFTGGDSAGGKIGPGGPVPGVPYSTRFNGTFIAEAGRKPTLSNREFGGRRNPSVISRCGSPLFLLTRALLMASPHSEGPARGGCVGELSLGCFWVPRESAGRNPLP